MTPKEEFDITDLIGEGDLVLISEKLCEYVQNGFNKLHFDGYDATISIYKQSKGKIDDA